MIADYYLFLTDVIVWYLSIFLVFGSIIKICVDVYCVAVAIHEIGWFLNCV